MCRAQYLATDALQYQKEKGGLGGQLTVEDRAEKVADVERALKREVDGRCG